MAHCTLARWSMEARRRGTPQRAPGAQRAHCSPGACGLFFVLPFLAFFHAARVASLSSAATWVQVSAPERSVRIGVRVRGGRRRSAGAAAAGCKGALPSQHRPTDLRGGEPNRGRNGRLAFFEREWVMHLCIMKRVWNLVMQIGLRFSSGSYAIFAYRKSSRRGPMSSSDFARSCSASLACSLRPCPFLTAPAARRAAACFPARPQSASQRRPRRQRAAR